MKKALILLLYLFPAVVFSQIKGVVIDNQTNEKIPYVNIWVAHKNIGTTSNEEGRFTLETNTPEEVIFSAIGFESKTITLNAIENTVLLEPQTIQLNEIVVLPRERTLEHVIGEFSFRKINHYFAGNETPWIIAKYMTYDDGYDATPFLKTLKFLTKSEVKSSTFNVRLYRVSENGSPGNSLYNNNIIALAIKGKHMTEVDVSALNIRFPKEGFFIAVEWLILPENKYEITYVTENSDKKEKSIRIAPIIGAELKSNKDTSWKYAKGKWKKAPVFIIGTRLSTKVYNTLAVEITLTN